MNHEDYPALYRSASDLSQRSQSAFYRAFLLHMMLLAIASGISVINSSRPEVAILQALVLIGALACAVYLFFVRPERNWYSGRAIAESIKTTTWRFISKAEPFNHSDEIDQHEFGLKLRAIVEQNQSTAKLLTAHLDEPQISNEMRRLRSTPLAERQEYYKVKRIADQQSWYAKKTVLNRQMVKRYFVALLVVIAVAIGFSLAKIQYPSAQYWPTDLFVTSAAGLLSWIQAKRYQELSASYALAAHEISLIREQASLNMKDADFSAFVGDAENAFSREHTQWVARQDR